MGAKVEEALELTGGFGRWHWAIIFIAAVPGLFFNANKVGMMFVAGIPDHWCYVPQLREANWTTEDIKAVAIPKDMYKGEMRYSQCYMYRRNYTSVAGMDPHHAELNDTTIEPCSHWEFDTSTFTSTIVTEWELVCDRLHTLSTIHSANDIGLLVGSLISGPLSDRFGRRTCAVGAASLIIVALIINLFSVNALMMFILRIVQGFCTFTMYSSSYALVAEVGSNEKRSTMTFVYDLFPGNGRWIVGLIAYLVRDWRSLLLAYTIPMIITAAPYWLLPESPRWLLVKGRTSEAEEVIRKAAKWNKKQPPDPDVLHNLIEASQEERKAEKKKVSCTGVVRAMLVFVRTRKMRQRSIPMFFCWFVISFVSYGLYFHFGNLPFNVYMLHIINGVLVTLTRAVTILWPLPDILGRKNCFLGCLILGGISGLVILAVPHEWEWLLVTLTLACSAFVSQTFTLVYLYTAELFPTEVRNTAISCGSIFARFGGLSAPFVANYFYGFHYTIPSAIFGGMSALAAGVCYFLPETKGVQMCETVAELEGTSSKQEE